MYVPKLFGLGMILSSLNTESSNDQKTIFLMRQAECVSSNLVSISANTST